MSDTPRTDAETVRDPFIEKCVVEADFARTLERENTALKVKLADANHCLDLGRCSACGGGLRSDISDTELSDASRAAHNKLLAENAALKAELDQVNREAAAMRDMVDREVAMEDRDRPGDCPADHGHANRIQECIAAIRAKAGLGYVRRDVLDNLLADAELTAKLLHEAPELNPSNYNHEDVCALNAKVCEACPVLEAAINAASAELNRTKP